MEPRTVIGKEAEKAVKGGVVKGFEWMRARGFVTFVNMYKLYSLY